MKNTSIFDAAVKYLSYRSRTEKEVRDYLVKKDFRRDKIPETIEKLKEYRYIDDADYTLSAIEYNDWGNKYGKTRLRRQLSAKGIGPENLELIESEISPEDERGYCAYHFRKALDRTEGETYKKRLPKIIAYLQRRGFTSAQYKELLSEVPKTGPVDEDEFDKHLRHYARMYSRKGFEGSEWRNKVIKGMLSRGYSYGKIKDAINELEEAEE